MKICKWLSLLVSCALLAKPVEPSVRQVHQELLSAQEALDTAKKMFNPYYAGPLLAQSPNCVPKGVKVIQPYLFITSTYGSYTGSRRMQSGENVTTLQPFMLFQAGLNTWMDFTVTAPAFFNWKGSDFAAEIGDTTVELGFQICKETPTRPVLRFTVSEIFPTGRYNRLSPSRSDIFATGTGSYQTTLGFAIGKIFWWDKLHPLNTRWVLTYNIPSKVYVEGFNAYGGGFGTKGKIKPGHTVAVDIGTELSLSQKWVFANDIVYSYSGSSSFQGTPGTTSTGAPASNGGPSNDQLSLAPAIEYNPNDSSGLVVGPWLTLTGRNSSANIQLVMTYYAAF